MKAIEKQSKKRTFNDRFKKTINNPLSNQRKVQKTKEDIKTKEGRRRQRKVKRQRKAKKTMKGIRRQA